MPSDILTPPPPPADARVRYGGDESHFIDLRLPQPGVSAPPLVMNIHGGFWRARYDLAHAGHFCAALTARGLATANVEYRRVGNEGGGWPGTLEDIRRAYEFLRRNEERHNFDATKVLVVGHSAGGQLALCLAACESGVRRVIALAGVLDLRRAYELHLSDDAVVEFLDGAPGAVAARYGEADPMQLSIIGARQVLIHGSADDVVPVDVSREYVAAKQRLTGVEIEDVRLVEIDAADHFSLIDPRTAAWNAVADEVWRIFADV